MGRSNGIELAGWQVAACQAWERGDADGPFRGTLEIFTGGGKTLIAVECLQRATSASHGLRTMIVVPTLALARQWRRVILTQTELDEVQVGALDGDHKDSLNDKVVLIAVLNSAADQLPAMAKAIDGPLMLIVDECHRAGAPMFSRVLDTPARYRLGLSATAEREDVDDDGVLIEYDDHVLGSKLGRIVYRFDLRAAREIGWLPEFSVHHHGVTLQGAERRRYEELTRRVDDLLDRLQGLGLDGGGARRASGLPGETGSVARAYVGAVSLRKDLLYRASERSRIAEAVVRGLADRNPTPRVLLFHERIDEAIALHERLVTAEVGMGVGLEHSRLSETARRGSLDAFAAGSTPILVSVKALVEGIDVPDADVGVSVASSASVRQRVQSLGRVLRRRFDGTAKVAEMHLVYVADTVDEAIYGKEDWSDLTGAAVNHYYLWGDGAVERQLREGPPRTPKPTEAQFLEQLVEHHPPDALVEWTPEWPIQEWRLDGRGTITDLSRRLVINPQGMASAVRRVKPTGGRFRVSRLGSVVVPQPGMDGFTAWFVGRVAEPFHLADEPQSRGDDFIASPSMDVEEAGETTPAVAPSRSAISAVESGVRPDSDPGVPFPGPIDKAGGTYRLRQKAGGLIERRTRTGREFAGTEDGQGDPNLVSNARRVLEAWRGTGEAGLTFHVNSRGDAYYTSGGHAHMLAHVPGGFAWPTEST